MHNDSERHRGNTMSMEQGQGENAKKKRRRKKKREQAFLNVSDLERLRATKGFTSMRNNVFRIKLMLWKILKPLDYFIVDLIIDKTIGYGRKVDRFSIEEICEKSGQRRDYIYIALKRLHAKGIISKEKLNSDFYLGLNEEFFGRLLTKKKEEELQQRKRKIRVVVDNSVPKKDETYNKSDSNLSLVQSELKISPIHTYNKFENPAKYHEITEEFGLLKKGIKESIKERSLKKAPDGLKDFKFFSKDGNGNKKNTGQLDDPEEEKARQLQMARKAGIL
jgi:hypothetical protein